MSLGVNDIMSSYFSVSQLRLSFLWSLISASSSINCLEGEKSPWKIILLPGGMTRKTLVLFFHVKDAEVSVISSWEFTTPVVGNSLSVIGILSVIYLSSLLSLPLILEVSIFWFSIDFIQWSHWWHNRWSHLLLLHQFWTLPAAYK